MKDLKLPPGDWAPAPDAPDLFLVSRKGELFSLRSMRIVAQNSINGYPGHVTKVGGRKGTNLTLKAHIQVAKAFHPNPDNLPEVNHKNGIKSCSEDWNLEWTTRSGNAKHAHDTGLIPNSGKKRIKLSDEKIKNILENEHGSSRAVAAKYGVDKSTIQRIRDNPELYT